MVLTHLVATYFLLQVIKMTSEISFKGFESATNMFSPVAHDDDDDGDSLLLVFPLLYFSKLASSYALCKEYL